MGSDSLRCHPKTLDTKLFGTLTNTTYNLVTRSVENTVFLRGLVGEERLRLT